MDFTAIDFETANRRRDSACQLAAVVVRGGKIVDTAMWMIRPEPFYFSPANIGVHGITPNRVKAERDFAGHWPTIASFLRSSPDGKHDCLVAHNASFDLGVLLGTMLSHQIVAPEMQYTCTRLVARQTWPGRSGYGLKPLADWLGIRFKHHDALEDSVACAKILLAAAVHLGVTSMEQLETTLRISRGTAGVWGTIGPKSQKRSVPQRNSTPRRYSTSRRSSPPDVVRETPSSSSQYAVAEVLDLQRLLIRASFIRSLAGQCVAFAGIMRKLSRGDAENLAKCLGACPQNSISSQTTVLVVGDPDERTARSGRSVSVNLETAEELRVQGHPIRILSEDEFLALVVDC